MSTQTSFQSILEQKLRSQPAQSTPSNATWNPDPAHLAFLMGTLHKATHQGPVAKLYPSKPRPPAPPPPPHSLSESQQRAFDFMCGNGASLSPSFTQKELRTAFRRAALRLHPDMNKGTSGPFIELKKHYAELLELFPANSSATE